MHMRTPRQIIGATEFKAKCLALLDEVDEHGGTLTITRRGRPIAVVGPVSRKGWKSPRDSYARAARIAGDIVNTDSSLWEAVGKQ
jgi:prevent-host-death family protein